MRRYDFYTLENLNNILKRDNATLITSLNKVTRNCNINFRCNCGEEHNKNSFYLFNKSGAFCKNCTLTNQLTKTKEAFLKKYNVENVFQAEEIKEQIKQTMLKKYGVEYFAQLPENIEAMKINNPMFIEENKEKIIQTCLERYGVEHISQTEEFKEKCKETYLERYGVEHISQTIEFREKVKEAFIQHYGVDNPNKVPEVREKIIQTCLQRYGVEHISQSQEIQERTQKNAKRYKEYKMPSGIIRKVQGYEPFALDHLITVYEEDDIKSDRKDVPRITYTKDDKNKYYFPDFYIPSQNLIIEVKSTWTYKAKQDNIHEKATATKQAGYNYEIWIYDSKGNKTVTDC